MVFDIEAGEQSGAKGAHELFMTHLGGLLLLGPMTIFLELGRISMLLPLIFSLLFVLYSYYRIGRSESWYVAVHWRLALRNYRGLFIGYGITALLFLLSWVVEFSSGVESPGQFLAVALIRIGVMPTIIMVFACFVIENGALNQVLQREVPERMVRLYPPPE